MFTIEIPKRAKAQLIPRKKRYIPIIPDNPPDHYKILCTVNGRDLLKAIKKIKKQCTKHDGVTLLRLQFTPRGLFVLPSQYSDEGGERFYPVHGLINSADITINIESLYRSSKYPGLLNLCKPGDLLVFAIDAESDCLVVYECGGISKIKIVGSNNV